MPRTIQWTFASLVLILPLSFTGCGGEGKSTPDTVRVAGTVYLDDKPLANAKVNFSTETFSAWGETNDEGKYELVQGAIPGENSVRIEKWEGGKFEINPAEGMDEGQFQAMAESPGAGPGTANLSPKQLVPARYSDETKSELTYPVPADGTQSADFRLKSK